MDLGFDFALYHPPLNLTMMTMMGRAKYQIILCDFVGFILTTIRMKVTMIHELMMMRIEAMVISQLLNMLKRHDK